MAGRGLGRIEGRPPPQGRAGRIGKRDPRFPRPRGNGAAGPSMFLSLQRPVPAVGGAGARRRPLGHRPGQMTRPSHGRVNGRCHPGGRLPGSPALGVGKPPLDRLCHRSIEAGTRPGGREAPAMGGGPRWPMTFGRSAGANDQAFAWQRQRPLPLGSRRRRTMPKKKGGGRSRRPIVRPQARFQSRPNLPELKSVIA